MRFGFIGSRPLHLVPFSSLPLHTLLFPLFFHVLLSSCLVTSSFSSFARIGPGLSVYVHFYLPLNSKHRFQVAQVFIMRWASSVVPVHLVPLSFQPHTHTIVPSRPLVMSSFFCLWCARTCALALTLALRLPSGRRVCVCPL